MYPLTDRSIRAVTAGTPESNSDNIRSALARDLPEFIPALCAHDASMVIVGSGPSLVDFADEIKAERDKGRPVCAINGAHEWLISNGIDPDLFVSCDPRTTIRPNVETKSKRTVYLLASRCHPQVFDHLKDCKVVLWHSMASRSDVKPASTEDGKVAWEDMDLIEECEVFRDRIETGKSYGVGGASTSGLRAITLAYSMGYRKVILFGFDSCLAADRDTKRFSGEKVGQGAIIDVIVDGRRFFCNGAMAAQAQEVQKIINALPGLNIEARGDGLIAAILAARKKRGFRT